MDINQAYEHYWNQPAGGALQLLGIQQLSLSSIFSSSLWENLEITLAESQVWNIFNNFLDRCDNSCVSIQPQPHAFLALKYLLLILPSNSVGERDTKEVVRSDWILNSDII